MTDHDPANHSMFLGDVSITGGIITQGRVINFYNSQECSQAFEVLKGRVVTGALHNSGEVSDPPKCHPGTRVAILEALVQWASLPEYPFPIKWLHGPAGAGKSAIMRTLAEMLFEQGLLFASFFLSRTGANRNSTQSLISTIAYQLCLAIPLTRVHIEEAIDKNPLIFQLSLSTQVQALIAEPLIAVRRELTQGGTGFGSFPRVIILDGLDECEGQDAQCEVLQVLCDCIYELPVPLALIVASRPEHHIRAAFDLGQLNQSSARIALDDSFEPDADIEKFFLDNFAVIKRTHPFKQYLPSPWPPANAVSVLVQKASGQFIYASTVVKFISPIRYNPTDRLAIILGALDPGTLKPFERLDLLYTTIFLMIDQEDLPSILQVLGSLMTLPTSTHSNRSSLSPAFIESLLGLARGEIRRLLFDLESLLSVTDDSVDIHIFHASLSDFLFDISRSKQFFIDKGMVYEQLARRCLQLFFTPEYDHFLECHLVDHTRAYFEKATPTRELHYAITHINILRLAKLSVQSGQRQIIYGLRRLAPVFLRAVQKSKFPDANILFSNHLQHYQEYLKLKLEPYFTGNWRTLYLILAAIHLKNLPSRNLSAFMHMAGLGLSEAQRQVDDDGLQILQDYYYNMKGDLSVTTFVNDVLKSHLIRNLSGHYANFAIHLMKLISFGSGFYVHSEEILGPISNASYSFGLYMEDILPGVLRNSPVREELDILVKDKQATWHYRQAYQAIRNAMNDYISKKNAISASEKQQLGEDLRNLQPVCREAVLANPSPTTSQSRKPSGNAPFAVYSPAKRTVKAESFPIAYTPPSQQRRGSKSESSQVVPKLLFSRAFPRSKRPPGNFATPKPDPHPPSQSRPPPRKQPISRPENQGISHTMNPSLNGTAIESTFHDMANLPTPVPTLSTASAPRVADAAESVSDIVLGSNASWVEVGLGDDGFDEVPQTPTSRGRRALMKVGRFLERVKSGKGEEDRNRSEDEVSVDEIMYIQ